MSEPGLLGATLGGGPATTTVLGIGADLASVADVADSIEHFGEKWLSRVFTLDERRRAGEQAARPLDEASRQAPQGDAPDPAHLILTSWFAAKEAIVKALAVPADLPLPWTDVELVDDGDRLQVRLHGAVARWALAREVDSVTVSTTARGSQVTAFAVATGTTASTQQHEENR